MDTIKQDIAFAIRLLRKSPLFACVAIGAIALGSAAVTTIYSVVNTVLFQTSPGVGHPERLVSVQRSNIHLNGFSVMSFPLYRDLRGGNRTLSGLAGFTEARIDASLAAGSESEAVGGLAVTDNYFDLLEVRPAAGRFFTPDEASPATSGFVAVISYRFWIDRFGGARDVLGKTIWLQASPFTIVGVAPPAFNGTTAFVRTDVYVPIATIGTIRHNRDLLESRGSRWLTVIGRLRDGVSRDAAESDLGALASRAEQSAGERETAVVRVAPLRPVPANGVTVVTLFMAVLMTVSLLVLLIAATNVASMLLARGVARQKEFVVRLAVGASRWRLIRMQLTESVLLFLLGGGTGVLLAMWLTRLAGQVHLNVDAPLDIAIPMDMRVLAFSLVVSLATGLLFGTIPALAATRDDLASSLRTTGSAGGDGRRRTRNVFVTAQLAMSVLLLVCAGLFLRAFQKGRTIDPGFRIDNVVVAPISLANAGYDSTRARVFHDALAERIASLPGVEATSFTSLVPLSGSSMSMGIDIPGVQPPPHFDHLIVPFETVGRDYFRVLQLPVLSGRSFDDSDRESTARTAVVTRSFAVKYFGSVDAALGRSFSIQKQPRTIVGVVADARIQSVMDDVAPFMFLLDVQERLSDLTLVVRARDASSVDAIERAITAEVRALDPTVTRPKVQLLDEAAAIDLLPQRVAAGVTAVLGAIGLALASLGLYGVVAYAVGLRQREFGIRMALGAQPRQVLRMVLGDGARLVAMGGAIGMALAIVGARLIARFLFGVSPGDPITFVAVPLALAAVSLIACGLPAWRASRLGVAECLRPD